MRKKIISILSIVILVFSGFVILGMLPDNGIVGNASAETWTQTTTTDFNNGENYFVDIDDGTLSLSKGLGLQWWSYGEANSDLYGNNVASAGDVNGDGFDDIIVGAYGNDDGGNSAGKAYVYYGSATKPSAMDDWNFTGEAINDLLGYSVASAGDVNDDGYDDVIISAYGNDDGGMGAGKAYVFHGSSTGLSTIENWNMTGEAGGDQFGWVVSSAGDVNGDGYDDVIVGANYNDDGGTNAGKVHVFHGSSAGLSSSEDWNATGEATYDQFGYCVASAGDVNGDNYDDVIVSAVYNDDGGSNAGKVYVYHGSSSGLSSTENWNATAEADFDRFGYSVASAGDVNDDGYDDVIIGAPFNDDGGDYAGKTYVYLGSAIGLSTSEAWNTTGETATDRLGNSVASAGDVNGDGYSDIIVAAYYADGEKPSSGKVYLFHGTLSGLSTSASWTASGEAGGYNFGISVASAGDVDGDGNSDIIVGEYFNSEAGFKRGKAYLFHNLENSRFDTKWSDIEETSLDYFGFSVASAGDVNGDGYEDIIVGAPGNDDGATDAGKAYVYYSSYLGSISSVPEWTTVGKSYDEFYGWSVASAGDVNGDGYDDVIIGAYKNDDGGTNAGKAFVYHGSSSGLSTTEDWNATGGLWSEFGKSVASAGDVNGDGYDDVIVGADYDYEAGNRNGKAIVFYGSSSGLSTTEDWNTTGEANTDHLGNSVASAGDVNGDGYDDVIVGANSNDEGGSSAGKAYVYLGSSMGLGTTYIWNATGGIVYGHFGWSVASTGDVNGDGYDDVIVGAYHDSDVKQQAGKAFVYYGSPTGLSFTDDWNTSGKVAENEYGRSVASAGDVNGDGYDDVIVGELRNDEGGENAGKVYIYFGSSTGLSLTDDWNATGEDAGDGFGLTVASVGDINSDGNSDFIVGAPNNDEGGTNAGKAYIYSKLTGYIEYGEFFSESISLGLKEGFRWTSISWEPWTQPDMTAVRFQIGTSNDGILWDYWGPDGTYNTYYTNARGNPISTIKKGEFWRYKACLYRDIRTIDTPSVTDIIVNFREFDLPEIRLTSPNGGEDWMKDDHYPITWEAVGIFDYTSVQLYYSTDNGASWTEIGSSLSNNGYYNWSVPNVNTGNAVIKIVAVDIYWNEVSDTSDASFAIDPPPFSSFTIEKTNLPISNLSPKKISHIPPTKGRLGKPLTFEISVDDDTKVESIVLFYKREGELDYQYKKFISSDGSTFTTSMEFKDKGLVQYYIQTSDGVNTVDSEVYQVMISDPDLKANESSISSDQDNKIIILSVLFIIIIFIISLIQIFKKIRSVNKLRTNNNKKVTKRAVNERKVGRKNRKLLGIFILIIIGMLVFNTFTDISLFMNANAETWTQNTTTDFNNGETIYVEVDEGTLNLSRGLALQWMVVGEVGNDRFGYSVASAGDVNGDGYDDVIVGAYVNDEGGPSAGKAYVFHGSAMGLSTMDAWNATGEANNDQLGIRVAGAGDVNGDGYDDVIVGAYGNDDGGSYAGKAYVYHGSPSGLKPMYAWNATGEAANDYFGVRVASVGDVNGDGYDDVIVAAYGNDEGGSFAGKVYVYYGSTMGLNTIDEWNATGEAANDYFGYSVASAGDVNGDGYDDAIVGAYLNDAGGADAGKVYIYHGSSTGLSTINDRNVTGEAIGDRFGGPATSAGDVNGDGYDDVIVGAYQNDEGGISAGKAYIFQVSPTGLNTIASWTTIGEAANDYLGFFLSTAGDVTGDGYDDVIVGAHLNDDGGSNAGKAYVYHGSPTGLGETPLGTWIGEFDGDNFGWAVASAGDVNGDGYNDVIVGGYLNDEGGSNAGKSYVYCGHSTELNTIANWTTIGEVAQDLLGNSVASAGDVNGDGYADVLIGAEYNDEGGTGAGKVYVFHGSQTGFRMEDDWNAIGEASNDHFGYSVASAGDVNGDGYADVIVGAIYNDDGGSAAGKVYVYHGSSTGLNKTYHWNATGEAIADFFGNSVSSAGDVNGDGYDDVIIGAYGNDSGGSEIGKAYVFLGSSSGLKTTTDWIATGEVGSDNFGWSVGSAGDVNGDGYDDVIVGAKYNDDGGSNAGKAYVYYGSLTGLSTTDNWNVTGEAAGDYFGSAVASAGDVNHDGYSDVIVGAYYNDMGWARAGKAYVYHGSRSGLSSTDDWNAGGDYYADYFGYSVASAGDVNGDGYDDVIVGAFLNDEGGYNAGNAQVFYGSSSGVIKKSFWNSTGEASSNNFGYSVASAGDVNGDGFDEVIVGAKNNDEGGPNAGKTYVFSYNLAQFGEFFSELFSSNVKDGAIWASISWKPIIQPENTMVKFQIGTSNDGVTWDFWGPDGTSNSYYTNPKGNSILSYKKGEFWRYRIFLNRSTYSESPYITEVSLRYREFNLPKVKLTSPNGGEDWMKESHYMITWESEGIYNSNPVRLYYSTDNGESWTRIISWMENTGHYNWTVPNVDTSSALIAITIIDIYGNWIIDTSDASFAIDPPPPGYKPSEGEIGSGEPIDNQPKSTEELEDSIPGSTQGKGSDEFELGLVAGVMMLVIISIIIILFTIFLIYRSKRPKTSKTSDNVKKRGKRDLRIKLNDKNKKLKGGVK